MLQLPRPRQARQHNSCCNSCCNSYPAQRSTPYMMLEAMTALLSLPRVISHRLRRSRMTVTRKRFSCSSCKQQQTQQAAEHARMSNSGPKQLCLAIKVMCGPASAAASVPGWCATLAFRHLAGSLAHDNKVTKVPCSFSTQTRHSILVGGHGCATNNMNTDSVRTSRPVCTCPTWPTSQDQPNSRACCH